MDPSFLTAASVGLQGGAKRGWIVSVQVFVTAKANDKVQMTHVDSQFTTALSANSNPTTVWTPWRCVRYARPIFST